MIVEWDNPWQLVSPQGTLPFNDLAYAGTTPAGYFFLDPARCSAGAGIRVTRDNVAQADGEVIHRKFRTGYVVELNCQLWETAEQPACGGVLRAMADLLSLHLEAIQNQDGRLVWTPSGWAGDPNPDDRMVDRVRLLGPSAGGGGGAYSVSQEKDSESPLTTVGFALLSPLPYAMDVTEITTPLYELLTGVTNRGNTNVYPIVRAYGPFSELFLINWSVTDELAQPLQIMYDATLPGASGVAAGHYAEFNFANNTVYLDGDGANLKPAIDVTISDFWPLAPGQNNIGISAGFTGDHVDLIWQSAFA